MSNNGKLYIREDITDWRDEAQREETWIEREEDIVAELDKGKQTSKIARAAVVCRELGKAPSDLMRPNKTLLMVGAMNDVSAIYRAGAMLKVHANNGIEYTVPGVIGLGKQDDIEESEEETLEEVLAQPEPSYVRAETKEGVKRNWEYLRRYVPGHIWNRLAVIHAVGDDVHQAADELKAEIDAMVTRLVG